MITLCHRLIHSAPFIFLCLSSFFSCFSHVLFPLSPHGFFSNPPKAISYFLCPFSLPVTPFHHHSFFLQPHLSIYGLRRIESERRALIPTTTSLGSHFLLIWYEWFTLTLLCPFPPLLWVSSLYLLSQPSLENLNLTFIVPPLAKLVFPAHKASQTVLINA